MIEKRKRCYRVGKGWGLYEGRKLSERLKAQALCTVTSASCLSLLQVVNAQVTDTGHYVCVADNLAGSAEKSFNLNVHGESEQSFYCVLIYVYQPHLSGIFINMDGWGG